MTALDIVRVVGAVAVGCRAALGRALGYLGADAIGVCWAALGEAARVAAVAYGCESGCWRRVRRRVVRSCMAEDWLVVGGLDGYSALGE